jgi:hypothetical protein
VGMGARAVSVICVFVCYLVCCSVCPWSNEEMSIYIYNIAETIFVVFVVDVEVSSCSIYLILLRKFSSL